MIPLAHDFTEETVLVFGGGSVGARKARHFATEAEVVVVSPSFAEESFAGAQRVRAAPEPTAVESWVQRVDPALVVAATDDEALNDAAAAAARTHGALLNRADRSSASAGSTAASGAGEERREPAAEEMESGAAGAGPGRPVDDVAVPATVREGDVVVSVSTGGRSPALARLLRERIEAEVEGAEAVATVTGRLRERLQEEDVPEPRRRAAVREAVRSSRLWTDLRSGDANVDQITEALLAEHLETT